MTERDGQGPRVPRTRQRRKAQAEIAAAAEGQAVTGVVGDASTSASTSRSGEDTRRRGWFWHWNHVVTQYAPLLGLKGVGLLNSYTVWTDRREESPHRGYAFPSQQSEADFYGEDRAELITINKILVALDLIEIRKEMVYRVDDKGRRWKVPHNFYRVKDQGEGVSLTTRDVAKVVALADQDRAVYRYLRKLFSPKFAPIDPDNVWHQILLELRPTATWQRLAALTERDETRASARSKAGHAARRTNDTAGVFSLPNASDSGAGEATADDSTSASETVANDSAGVSPQTSVTWTNTGSPIIADGSNKGLAETNASSVGASNTGGATNVGRANRIYNQVKTTTTTDRAGAETTPRNAVSEAQMEILPGETTATNDHVASTPAPAMTPPPDARRDEDRAIRRFEEANERTTTIAERRLLRNLAEVFAPAAATASVSGWHWVGEAIDEAVASGSSYVAPKRIREILARWQAEGVDTPTRGVVRNEPLSVTPSPARRRTMTAAQPDRVTAAKRSAVAAAPAGAPPAPFTITECGLTNRQVWNAALTELRVAAEFGRAGAETWLRDTHLIGRTADGGVVVGVSNAFALRRLEGRYLEAIARAIANVVGMALPVTIADYRTWLPDASVSQAEPA